MKLSIFFMTASIALLAVGCSVDDARVTPSSKETTKTLSRPSNQVQVTFLYGSGDLVANGGITTTSFSLDPQSVLAALGVNEATITSVTVDKAFATVIGGQSTLVIGSGSTEENPLFPVLQRKKKKIEVRDTGDPGDVKAGDFTFGNGGGGDTGYEGDVRAGDNTFGIIIGDDGLDGDVKAGDFTFSLTDDGISGDEKAGDEAFRTRIEKIIQAQSVENITLNFKEGSATPSAKFGIVVTATIVFE